MIDEWLPPGVDRLPSGRYRGRAAFRGRKTSRTFSTPEAAYRWREDAVDRSAPAASRRARLRPPRRRP